MCDSKHSDSLLYKVGKGTDLGPFASFGHEHCVVTPSIKGLGKNLGGDSIQGDDKGKLGDVSCAGGFKGTCKVPSQQEGKQRTCNANEEGGKEEDRPDTTFKMVGICTF